MILLTRIIKTLYIQFFFSLRVHLIKSNMPLNISLSIDYVRMFKYFLS